MENVLLVVHLILAFTLIIVVMLQRTAQDGGGLMGSSGTMGGLFTARGSANLLTRTTAILATLFICTSLTLGIMAARGHEKVSLGEKIGAMAPVEVPQEAVPEKAPSVPVSK